MSDLLNKRFKADGSLIRSEEADGCLLYNPVNGEIRALNETGAHLFSLLLNGGTGLELVESLLAEFEGVERADAEADVSEFLKAALHFGLICESQ